MRITTPFTPLRVETENLCHTVQLANKSYTIGANGMISSILVEGEELLAAPMRIVLEEDGEAANFDLNYAENESESFIQRRSDEEAIICGCMQSERFVLDFCNTISYDGNIEIDTKLMPRGKTVAQVFGLAETKPVLFKIDKLWLEIPLRKEIAQLYNLYENGDIVLSDESIIEMRCTSSGGKIPALDAAVPFKPLLWLGNDHKGLGWCADHHKNWQPADKNKAMEIIHEQDAVTLRIHLLDSQPVTWDGDPTEGVYSFHPVEFAFGFMPTPVKKFPQNPYIHKALHIDCGIKIKGNYMDFFAAENRFDRLVEKGVDTLILHEKWNKSQNWYELSEYTAKQIQYIVDECHKRGIKVLTYFGYEFSTMSPAWCALKDEVTIKDEDSKIKGGWWRVPFQRDYHVCYNSPYADLFTNGIANLMDTYNIDGVYLDGTARPDYCTNLAHGCGWYDADGNLQGTYNIRQLHKVFQKLYGVVKSRGGQINVHAFGYFTFPVLPYIDQLWLGENLQVEVNKGTTADLNLDYFRAEYSGRNFGVPVEFIVYENRPYWTFEQALSCALLHGILPRPNDIEYPLEFMSGIWKIFDKFPIPYAQWMPYHENGATATHEKVKVSYYKHETLSGKTQLLCFVVNTSAQDIHAVTIDTNENITTAMDSETGESIGFTFDLKPYGYKILYIE